ncbi:MAG: T9SS type A sorting domain-containing protein, partial [candidate division KSB1 bacterium]
LPGDTGKLQATLGVQGTLDPTPGPSAGFGDAFQLAIRTYSGGHWSFWNELAVPAVLPPAAFGTLTVDLTPLIGVADSVQMRLGGYSYPDGAVVAPANIFVDNLAVNAIAIQNDVAAVNVVVPFPAKVGDALNFGLTVTNTGSLPQSGVQWQGNILDAAGAQVASVVGRRTEAIAPGATVAIPALTNWTPATPGVYRVRAFTRLATDEDRSNDSTSVANDDANTIFNIFGAAQIARHSPFVVHDANVLYSARLYDLPASPSPQRLIAVPGPGMVVRSAPQPGVVTWQTTASALVLEANGGPGYKGAYIVADSLGRPQDEELIIPNLDFSFITSGAILTFKGIGSGGFTGGYTRFSIGVSSDNGQSWSDVFERRRGIDPQTGQNFGGAVFFLGAMSPGRIDITRWAAGRPNVWVRFRYEGINDGDWIIWSVAVSGKGVQAANAVSAVDIAGDQGKQMRVTWDRSANDGTLAGVPITEYGVWRRDKPAGAQGIVKPEPGAIVVADRAAMIGNIAGLKTGTRFFESSTMNHWDFVGNVIARSEARYGFVSPTLVDSLVYQFLVSAHTANPLVFGNSNVVEGFSVDNLAPNAVQLSGGAQSGFVQLSWSEPDNEEAKFYSVYRRLSSEPSFGAAIAKIGASEYRDTNIQKSTSYVYAVTATDFGSNESKRSNELPVTSTAVAGQNVELPTSYALNNNYPNPFNPTTMITYQIPKAGEVKLTIINSLGQKVRTLVFGQVAAGYHQALWDARDDSGTLVGSGTYLYRIEAGDFVQTKKLVLMK